MLLGDVLHAMLYVIITIASVTALAVAIFGPSAALERWLDAPMHARPELGTSRAIAAASTTPPNDPGGQRHAA